MKPRPKAYDLDQTMDEEAWIREHPVYCTIPYCRAHKLRFDRCGDKDGPYEGIHVGRIRSVKRNQKRMERRLTMYEEMGYSKEQAERAVWLSMFFQQAIDTGAMTGKKRGL